MQGAELGVVPQAANGAHRIDFQHACHGPVAQEDQPGDTSCSSRPTPYGDRELLRRRRQHELLVSLTTAKSAYINNFGVTQHGGPPEATSNGRLLDPGDTYSSIANPCPPRRSTRTRSPSSALRIGRSR